MGHAGLGVLAGTPGQVPRSGSAERENACAAALARSRADRIKHLRGDLQAKHLIALFAAPPDLCRAGIDLPDGNRIGADANLLTLVRRPVPPADSVALLTEPKAEGLNLFARGLKHRVVAGALSTSPHTVGDHVKAIYRELSVQSRSEAVYESVSSALSIVWADYAGQAGRIRRAPAPAPSGAAPRSNRPLRRWAR